MTSGVRGGYETHAGLQEKVEVKFVPQAREMYLEVEEKYAPEVQEMCPELCVYKLRSYKWREKLCSPELLPSAI